MNGLMMDMPLLVSAILQHAARHHCDVEIVSRVDEWHGLRAATRRERHEDRVVLAPQIRADTLLSAQQCFCDQAEALASGPVLADEFPRRLQDEATRPIRIVGGRREVALRRERNTREIFDALNAPLADAVLGKQSAIERAERQQALFDETREEAILHRLPITAALMLYLSPIQDVSPLARETMNSPAVTSLLGAHICCRSYLPTWGARVTVEASVGR